MSSATIPAEQCYWALVPASDRPWTPERLRTAIEPWTPSDVDRLDLAWCMADDRQALIVAVEPQRIDAILAANLELDDLTPDRIPDHVQAVGVAASDLHLLTGSRQPVAQRRLANRLCWLSCVCAGLTGALLIAAAVRHHARITDRAAQHIHAAASALDAALPTALTGAAEDPLDRLDQAQRMYAGLAKAVDGSGDGAAVLCNRVLAGLPADLRLQVQSVTIDGQRLVIVGTTPDVATAQAMSTAVAAVIATQAGWRMLPLQAATTPGTAGIAFTCSAQRDGGGG